MKRRFTILTAALALLTFLAVPMGMRGQTYTQITELDMTTKAYGTSNYNANTAYMSNSLEWHIVNGANNNKQWAYFKMGGKSATLANANPCYIYSPAISEQVDKVTVHLPSGSLSKSGMSVNSWGLYVYSNSAMTTQVDYVAGGTITNSDGSFDFTPSTGVTWAANYYYKVNWNLANTTTTNGIVCVDKITLYKESGGGDTPTTYTVTYDGNGNTSGTVPTDDNEYDSGDEVTVLGSGNLAKTGYAFSGWNTVADGSGDSYSENDTFEIDGNTTLYAQWTAYSITAQSNNTSYGTVSLSDFTITATPASGCRYASPAYTVSSGSATVVQSGDTFTVTPSSNCTITINFEAIPTHTATFSVNGTTSTQTVAEGAAITFPANPADINGKTFVGWTAEAITSVTQTPPTFVTSATMGNSDVTFYAVFAEVSGSGSASLTKMTSSDTFAVDDKVVIVAVVENSQYAMYQETVSNSYVNYYIFDNNASTVAADDKNWFTVSAGSNGAWKLGDDTNGYVYNSSSNNLAISSNSTDFTLAWNNTESKFTLKAGSRWLSYRSDLDNNYFRMGGTGTTPNGTAYFDIYKYVASSVTYSNYCTTVPSESTWFVTYNGNGADGGEVPTDNNEYNASYNTVTVLGPGTLTKTGHTFSGWNTANDGTGTSYAADATFTISANTTLYAQWTVNSYSYSLTVTGDDDDAEAELDVDGSAAGATIEYGKEVEVVVVTNTGYVYSISVKDANNNDITVADDKFTMPASNVTVTVTTAVIPTYTLITSIDQLVSGKHYIIASGTKGSIKAMGSQSTNNRAAVTVESTNGVITETANVFEFVIIGPDVNGNYTIYDVENQNYLHATGTGSSNHLKLQDPITDRGLWEISFSDQAAVIKAITTETDRKIMRYNSGSTCFSCYGTGQNPIYLYAKDNEATVSYTLDITSYETTEETYEVEKGGYYLIASPVGQVNPTAANGILTNNFDLYSFNDSFEGSEWRNYEETAFNLVSGRGYLYANNGNKVSLTFTGMPYVGNGQVFLSYTEDKPFTGWNLIGNPFATNATIPSTRGYYVLNPSGSELLAGTTYTIEAKEGIFVQASAAGESVTFTQANAKGNNVHNTNLVLNLSNSYGIIDRAIVRFDEGSLLPKFQINPNNTKLYITEGNKDYAVVRSANQGEMPVSFKAAENGNYTLSVEAENVEASYLHLIDNMTGADVDLLATPSYSFEARTTDYANRFRLVFNANGVNENNTTANFAYFNGSSWTVSNMGEATLQVVDMMGRIVSTQAISGNTEISINQVPGVYMLRLVNGENVMVQKVVVR